jgi:hypothetical protein
MANAVSVNETNGAQTASAVPAAPSSIGMRGPARSIHAPARIDSNMGKAL